MKAREWSGQVQEAGDSKQCSHLAANVFQACAIRFAPLASRPASRGKE
ncbi:Uncharacterised protein [Vibrio cholerae]|nr:Uncharacterised protein [Vibrio cholerae]